MNTLGLSRELVLQSFVAHCWESMRTSVLYPRFRSCTRQPSTRLGIKLVYRQTRSVSTHVEAGGVGIVAVQTTRLDTAEIGVRCSDGLLKMILLKSMYFHNGVCRFCIGNFMHVVHSRSVEIGKLSLTGASKLEMGQSLANATCTAFVLSNILIA